MSKNTKIRLALAVLVFMMVQAVLFGVGMIVLLLEPQEIKSSLFSWIPIMIAVSCIISAPIAWWIAPHLRARYWRKHEDPIISSIS